MPTVMIDSKPRKKTEVKTDTAQKLIFYLENEIFFSRPLSFVEYLRSGSDCTVGKKSNKNVSN